MGLLLHRWIIENIKFVLPCCQPLPLLHLPHHAAAANAANVAANATNTETWARTRPQVLADVSFSENLLKKIKNKKFVLGEKIKLDFIFIFFYYHSPVFQMFFSAYFSFIAAHHRRQSPFYSLCHLKSDSFHFNLETSGRVFFFSTVLWRVSALHSSPLSFMAKWKKIDEIWMKRRAISFHCTNEFECFCNCFFGDPCWPDDRMQIFGLLFKVRCQKHAANNFNAELLLFYFFCHFLHATGASAA